MNYLSRLQQRQFIFCTALLVLTATHLSYAAESPSFPEVIAEDFKYEFTAPSRWDTQDWKNLGWAALTVAGVSVVTDTEVRDYMRQQPRGNTFLNTVENFGQTYAFGLMGGYYLAGAISGDEKTTQVSQDLITASMISATINQTLKTTVTRYRPRDDQGTYNFQGFVGLNNNSSFPSGHTTEAFTLASVFASSYEDEAWVGYAAYSVASLVGVARMYNDAHWASDVTASVFIGIWTGRSVVEHNKSFRSNKVVLLPMLGPDFSGAQLVGNF